ncbi:N(2)-acetyl-L-2,4-diaminobutanoate deacetylase DoeB [Pseudomonas sp. V98_8]|jgi:N-alpha-acetyl-L-2,4-diaminobutyrate deacetylase|uniref:N(2)-acetyl-L-2,4-diaminobutanoate deacetylase DoeB n=1 Tax=unclassified Pseudomonas TaxID=196821 RepID=UPI0016614F1C|nr:MULTISPECIES: N(2)-acetyl-L-2,4-diaminobutanoate deacetylase DoeB [unclassified Pseudomonas]MBD0679085.1 N-alpha-acetyl diaminobutyric acid deacetylase DoeB [Pseudomonas sp. PSB11]MDI3391960.1 N(2)-acetyl-L-2,4-diaminobutanoate deacetylase DoeB [Pseudomonas sp. V98_8]MDP9686429.1 N-alpha-acetyl-L-2,4-diaminobutyrate deacetylase [Pseudomonas mohnii]
MSDLPVNPISATVDFNRQGVQHGFLKLPYSRDDSAWGAVMIPLTVISRGDGPTALLTGGNHGDEYEGPVALSKLAQSLTAAEVSGRVIIVPFMNTPAFHAGRRTSPIDKGNLNRSFPGKPDGTVTEKIADYFTRTLLPLADIVLDIHSGGRTLDFLPFAACHVLADNQQQAQCEAGMRAFNAPYSMRMLELDAGAMYDTAAESQGKVFVTTELGGGGSSTALSVAIAERGVRNLLVHAGILEGELQTAPSIMLDMPDSDCFIASEHDGLLEMCRDLGENVSKGEVIARVYDVTRSGVAPVEYRAARNGLLAARHFPGLVGCGDTLAVIADVLT